MTLDIVRKLLPKFNTPLIEGINIPNETLHCRPVFVNRKQLTRCISSELGHEQGYARTIALENAMGNEFFFDSLCSDFFFGLAIGKGIGLGKEVGHEFVVGTQRLIVQAQIVLGLTKSDKVTGSGLTHVQKLEERVLSVRTGFAKVNFTNVVVYFNAMFRHNLSIGFHIQLLNVRGQSQKSFSVGKRRSGLVPKEGMVPYTQQTQNNGNVLFHRSGFEMFVYRLGALQKLFKKVKPIHETDRDSTDGAANTVSSANPVPESEKVVLRVDSELLDLVDRGNRRASHDVLSHDVLVIAHKIPQPLTHGSGIEHGFGSGEGF
mmetsp:Transcript_22589/g.47831  ORF Transcript_22589/g.47831 Transcript_22589/m.47831 type:complete len:319 (+) Transcript_22589:1132-2088(+)